MSDDFDQLTDNDLREVYESWKLRGREIERLRAEAKMYSAAADKSVPEALKLSAEVERLKGVLGDIKRNADCGGDAGLFRWQTLSEIIKALEANP